MLEKELFPHEKDPNAIRDSLMGWADKVLPDESYYKDLEPDEIAGFRAEVSDKLIKVNQIKQDIKSYTALKKEQMKPLEQELSDALDAVKTGQLRVKGTLYLIADHDERMMGTYDESGKLISSRPLKPEERQTSILSISARNRAANDTTY
ncbi:hypothetical protein CLV24_11442 [Pontibacter ummariensis]|uniref:Uncharacterized protein n=1 Tax=Pontibacter ummariensis TaxID=1610492 RepID=A0A239HMG8_9BACT|nr:hypothetical protein [Pontibacter ummariensis]PRY10314.1 hypothetical protein CLV24_11442 [Pontibacter ummariensis]SNS82043.1 hypothetical protein SAMN06296052_11442 [Pontibacter ummariensis]